jgi:CDP-diacylglycerol--glycerol-3-phosphate 3-phosphatidyltransferase
VSQPALAACGHRGCVRPESGRLLTAATVLTFARTGAAMTLALLGARHDSLTLLLWGLAVYWVGDTADGALARLLDSETRPGAMLDIVCDRACAACFYLGFAWLDPTMALPVGVYLFSFMVVDTYLSLAFLGWPLTSPNYFYLVDRPIWLWNWSLLGKAVNSSAFALLLVVTREPVLVTAIAIALLVLKVVSTLRLTRLAPPLPSGCAASWVSSTGGSA